MFDKGRYLVLIDFDQEPQIGLDRALELAKAKGASITALMVVYDWAAEIDTMMSGTILNNLRKPYLAAAKEWLTLYLKKYEGAGVEILPRVEWNKRPYKTVIESLKADNYQLVVKSTQHHSLIKRTLRTPDDWHLVRLSEVPVLFVKESGDWQGKDVLVAVDPGNGAGLETADDSQEAFNRSLVTAGQALASTFAAEIALVNAYPILTGMVSLIPEAADYQAYEADIRKFHEASLKAFAESQDIDTKKLHLRQGAVGPVVNEVVEELKSPLVICGTHARRGIEGALLGNSAESILEHVDCDLLVVRD